MTKMESLNDLKNKVHEAAKAKGFWEKPREFGTLLMLVVSELSEALEADRKGKTLSYMKLAYMSKLLEMPKSQRRKINKDNKRYFVEGFEKYIKGTVEEEIADAIIRLLDISGGYNIDIERMIALKMRYNETRAKMHDKKY